MIQDGAKENPTLDDIHLVLFMTRGMSLDDWRRGGLLHREIALYKALAEKLAAVSVVTFGGAEDMALSGETAPIDVVCNNWRLPPSIYRRILPGVLRRRARGRLVVKSNQTSGADLAFAAARSLKAPFVARAGYPLCLFTKRLFPGDTAQAQEARDLERAVFTGADHVQVTTAEMKADIIRDYGVAADKVSVVPNYVRTDLFRPDTNIAKVPRRIWFAGRLEEQKNLKALVSAAGTANASLHIAGDGSLRQRLENQAREEGVDAVFYGYVAHQELPKLMLSGELFVLPSHYEGHPKTLLEAMALALPVIGTDVPGIREVIDPGVTGILCPPDPESLGRVIDEILGQPEKMEQLGQAARKQVVRNNALERIVDREAAVLETLVRRAP